MVLVVLLYSQDKTVYAPFQVTVTCPTTPKTHPFKQYVLYQNDKRFKRKKQQQLLFNIVRTSHCVDEITLLELASVEIVKE